MTITGIKEIDFAFQNLERKLRRKILREEMKKALAPLHKTAVDMAPRDKGNLKRAIKARAGKRKRHQTSRAVIVDKKRLENIQTGVRQMREYVAGQFMEYGTRNVRAQSYMVPTVRAMGANAIKDARSRIAHRILKEVKAKKFKSWVP